MRVCGRHIKQAIRDTELPSFLLGWTFSLPASPKSRKDFNSNQSLSRKQCTGETVTQSFVRENFSKTMTVNAALYSQSVGSILHNLRIIPPNPGPNDPNPRRCLQYDPIWLQSNCSLAQVGGQFILTAQSGPRLFYPWAGSQQADHRPVFRDQNSSDDCDVYSSLPHNASPRGKLTFHHPFFLGPDVSVLFFKSIL